jgi:hypothetical protein
VTGTVTFGSSGGGAFVSTSCILILGHCSVTYTPSAATSQTLTGTYSGDTTHTVGDDSDVITATKRATETTVDCLPSTVAVGVTTTCTADVTDISAGTKSTPTGTVAAQTGGTGTFGGAPCALTMVSGSESHCTFTYTPTTVGSGTHLISGTYGSDAAHAGAAGTDDLTVTARRTATTFECVPDSVHAGLETTCTATVADTDGGTTSTPSGAVQVTTSGTGGFSASSCTLTAGACSVTYTPAAIGTDHLQASFGGDAAHATSSDTADVSAAGRTSALALACDPLTLETGATTTCTATATDADGGVASTPTGTVMVMSDSAGVIDPPACTLAAGTCAFSYVPDAAGTPTLTAIYAGDAVHAAAPDAIATLAVTTPTPTPTPSPTETASPMPSSSPAPSPIDSPTPSPTETPSPTTTPSPTRTPTPPVVKLEHCFGKDPTIAAPIGGAPVRGTAKRDVIAGTTGDDTIKGGRGNDLVCGGPGADRLTGNGGSDRVFGGTGKDVIHGNGGPDLLVGGGAKDRISAGSGNDSVRTAGSAADTTDCGPGRDTISLDKSDVKKRCEKRTRPKSRPERQG